MINTISLREVTAVKRKKERKTICTEWINVFFKLCGTVNL